MVRGFYEETSTRKTSVVNGRFNEFSLKPFVGVKKRQDKHSAMYLLNYTNDRIKQDLLQTLVFAGRHNMTNLQKQR